MLFESGPDCLGAAWDERDAADVHVAGFDGTLIEPYEAAGKRIYHLDLYRLADPGEVEPLGIRDLLSEAPVLLIEWPSRAAGALPAFDLTIGIDYLSTDGDGRRVTLQPHSSSGANVVQRIVAAIPEMRLLSL